MAASTDAGSVRAGGGGRHSAGAAELWSAAAMTPLWLARGAWGCGACEPKRCLRPVRGSATASLKARRSSAAFALAVSFLAVSLSNPLFLLPFFFFRVGNRVLPSHLFALKGAWTSFGRRVAFTPRLRGMRRPRLRLPLLDPSKDLDTVRSASIPSSWPQPGGGQPPRRPWRDSVGSAPVGTTG